MKIDNQIACRSIPQQMHDKCTVVSKQKFRLALAALALASFGGFASAQVLPNDVEPTSTCKFAVTEFPGWFGGTVTPGGAVEPPDSLNLLTTPADPVPSNHAHCKFYKWAARMFLWLTSPLSGGRRTLQSENFYDISAPINGKRTLTRNDPGKSDIDFSLRTAKLEHAGLPGLPGQPRGVLMAQNKSLIYTASFVNDAYAFYLTGAKNHRPGFDGSKFPILQTELGQISALATAHGVTLGHPETLVLEVKTTWVETAGFSAIGLDPTKYIRITAAIPTYDMSDPNKWIPKIGANGSNEFRETELALVGMHVVGSASGNSNMIWATYEHIDNTPIATYAYQSLSGRKNSQSTGGPWLFSRSNPTGQFNQMHMHTRNSHDIEAEPGNIIGPSDTLREHAWGSSDNNPDHNSRVIGINAGTMRMLLGDVRRNYLLIGASWGGGVGSDRLANTTLETYEQGRNCSICHKGDHPDGLSRMYGVIQPLFP
jgi:hypothetical protein